MGRRGPVVIAILVVVAAGAIGYAGVQQRRADAVDARLRAIQERARSPSPTPEDELDKLVGDALEGFGGDSDALDDLLGGSGASLLECLGTGGSGPDLEGLLGSAGKDKEREDGGLGDLFGSIGKGKKAKPEDMLERLLGDLGPQSEASSRSAPKQVKDIARAVEQIRGLEFERKVDSTFVPPAEVARRAARIFLADYPVDIADAEGRMLAAFGAIPRSMDLRATAKDLLESQVAGFYVPQTGELVVPSADRSRQLTGLERTILAHELTHALVDQRLELPEAVAGAPDASKGDETLAILGVVEGDATLAMQRYSLSAVPLFEQLTALQDPAYAKAQQALEGVPPYLVKELEFPYLTGLQFACELFRKGGWAAIDDAYADPPESAAQVMFPARYFSDERPLDPRDPSRPGTEWREALHSSFGAPNLLWLFEAPGGDEVAALSDAAAKAGAWGGGEITVWERGASSAVGTAFEQRAGSAGLCGAVASWYRAAWPDDAEIEARAGEVLVLDGAAQDAVVWCSGTEVRLGIAPGIEEARAIVR